MTRHRSRALARSAGLLAPALLVACSALMPEVGPLHSSEDAGDARAGEAAADAATAGEAGPRGDSGPTTFTVAIAPNDTHTFSPASLDIRVGDTVHWVWAVGGHTVTSGSPGRPDGLFCSPDDTSCSGASTSRAGATYDHVFTSAGSYPYFCRPHAAAGMVGVVHVQ